MSTDNLWTSQSEPSNGKTFINNRDALGKSVYEDGEGDGEESSQQRLLCESLLRLAEKNEIPLQEDPEIMEILDSMNIMEDIPSELYMIVSETIKYFYDFNEYLKQEENVSSQDTNEL